MGEDRSWKGRKESKEKIYSSIKTREKDSVAIGYRHEHKMRQ